MINITPVNPPNYLVDQGTNYKDDGSVIFGMTGGDKDHFVNTLCLELKLYQADDNNMKSSNNKSSTAAEEFNTTPSSINCLCLDNYNSIEVGTGKTFAVNLSKATDADILEPVDTN
ncbi:MAG: hypothetical protein WCO00_17900 [Rhodospirillaceae bacterium]